ncbi:insulinase family protein [Microbacterium sp. CCNWLW134]|uniref:insulinase family protein n=1 Tax=Microbacterium sp. CCNWLW134 TaxID=3122064 RepID=UPI00300FB3CB
MVEQAQGVLADGTRVAALRVPGARALGVSVAVAGGFADDSAAGAGRAHLVEHLRHHHAVDASSQFIDAAVLSAGGLSNAQTYPFHTEYSFLVPADDRRSVLDWIGRARGRLEPWRATPADLAREIDLVRREVAERAARSPLAGFPWCTALSGIAGGDRPQDALSDLAGLDDVSLADLDGGRVDPRSAAIGIAGDVDPATILADLDASPSVTAAPFHPLSSPTPREISLRRIGLGAPARSDIRLIDLTQPGVSRGLLMIATRILSATSGSAWRSGLFGELLGPDAALVLATQIGATDDGVFRLPTPLSGARAHHAAFEPARRGAARAIDEYLSGTGTASALVARDVLAGFDVVADRSAVADAAEHDVIDLCAHILQEPSGRVVWEPVVTRPGAEAAA